MGKFNCLGPCKRILISGSRRLGKGIVKRIATELVVLSSFFASPMNFFSGQVCHLLGERSASMHNIIFGSFRRVTANELFAKI